MSGRRKGKRPMGHPARVAAQSQSERKKKSPSPRRPAPPTTSQARRTQKSRQAPQWPHRLWTSLTTRWLAREPLHQLPLVPFTRVDLIWAAATGGVSAVLFATVITGHTALGDAPETVAGVSSLGVLHAPGYPSYVIVAKLFTLLEPFGQIAFRVNLFSLVCASLSIAGAQLLARRFGAARWAGAVAALALAGSSGFVFYSGFAKHDMFSGLVFIVTLHLVLAFAVQPSSRRLIALAAAIGVGLGSSWPLELLVLPTVFYVLVVLWRSVSPRALLSATATGLVVVVAAYGFVMVRAGENPPLNWGDATSIGRVADLVKRTDFVGSGAQHSPPSSGARGVSVPPGAGTVVFAASGVSSSVTSYGFIFVEELGIAAALLAIGGLAVTAMRRRKWSYALVITFVINAVSAAALVGPGSSHTLTTALVEEGFLLGCYFSLAAWAAVGATELVALLTRVTASRLAFARANGRWVAASAATALAVVMIVPVVPGATAAANAESPPFADGYARSIFAQLPPHAVIFIFGAELTQPLIYQQVVDHRRPDVLVIAADGLAYPWYRDEVSRRLGRPLPALTRNTTLDAARVVDSLIGIRPAYLDPQTVEALKGQIGYRRLGLLAQATRGTAEAVVSSPAALDANVLAAEHIAGLSDHNWNLWPNDLIETSTFSTAELGVAGAFYHAHDLTGMRRALRNVVAIQPDNATAIRDLALFATQTGSG